jgi:formamidopyrimidine-DNA glycosylase
MPELPEVETIRRGLEGLIVGATITDVTVRLPKMVRGELQSVRDAEIQRVRRRGKGLLIELDNGYTIAIHVKMTGQLIYKETEGTEETKGTKVRNLHPVLDAPLELPGKHTHVIFKLIIPSKRHSGKPKAHPESLVSQTPRDPGPHKGTTYFPIKGLSTAWGRIGSQARMTENKKIAYLFYNDIRQFGWIHVLPTEAAEALPFFSGLGPEPLLNLDEQTFSTILDRTKAPIKQVLMDQSRLAGVGNIYANDALFHASIHPLRPANDLTEEERKKLFTAVEFVLTEGIKAGGASEENFLNALGEKGFYQEKFLVYKKTGQPCQRCSTAIERIVVGGRGTFFCPECQV